MASSHPIHDSRASAVARVSSDQELWNAAYQRFESADDEVRKFVARLRKLGADRWPKDAHVAELFCGRGNGLHALQQLGFSRLTGVDLSPELASMYSGAGRIVVSDCRDLPLADGSADIAIVQGGLHHLPTIPTDLERAVGEAHRILRRGGRFVIVEPWRTPFLSLVHAAMHAPLVRRLSSKVDAFATMVHYERQTYEQWLASPTPVLDVLGRYFPHRTWQARWGKLLMVAIRD